MSDRPTNLSEFLLNFMKSYQDLAFSTRIQDGSPMDNQGDEKRKCLTGRKTLASFCWIWRGPIRTSLFPPGSRMGAQWTTKGKKTENVWQAEKPYRVFVEFYEVLPGPHFFHQDPGWEPKGQPRGRKNEMSDRPNNLSEFSLNFMRSYQDLTFSTRIQDGSPRDNKSDENMKCLTGRKTLASFLLNFTKSYQDLAFSSRTQHGSPRDNQRDKKRTCLIDRKTLPSYCWILRSPIRTSLFTSGSRMGAQGTTKETKYENVWQAEEH